jgi:hypothetical protein
VDIDDLAALSTCLAAASFQPGCEIMDMDGNGAVVASDFADFARRYEGPFFDCDSNGIMDAQDITGVSSGSGVPAGCQTFDPALGGIPDGNLLLGQPLVLDKLAGVDVVLSWADVCGDASSDYSIYRGPIGQFDNPTPLLCSTGLSTTAIIQPIADSSYYLIVPNNAVREGSYGEATSAPRNASLASCYAQAVTACN